MRLALVKGKRRGGEKEKGKREKESIIKELKSVVIILFF